VSPSAAVETTEGVTRLEPRATHRPKPVRPRGLDVNARC
jgi:hypothetical protein